MNNKLTAYTLCSSSSGNCTYIKHGDTELLLDAGATARQIDASLKALGSGICNIRGIFVSHEHSDHTKGLQTLSKNLHIPIYTDPKCMALIAIKAPAAEDCLCPTYAGDIIEMDGLRISVYPTPHDSARSFCYRFETDKESLGFATDIGHISDAVQDALFGCDYVVAESNYDEEMLEYGPYPAFLKERIASKRGHLSNKDCASLAPVLAGCGTKSLVLAHLSETNNTPRQAFTACRDRLAEYGVSLCGESLAGDMLLQVASPTQAVKITF